MGALALQAKSLICPTGKLFEWLNLPHPPSIQLGFKTVTSCMENTPQKK